MNIQWMHEKSKSTGNNKLNISLDKAQQILAKSSTAGTTRPGFHPTVQSVCYGISSTEAPESCAMQFWEEPVLGWQRRNCPALLVTHIRFTKESSWKYPVLPLDWSSNLSLRIVTVCPGCHWDNPCLHLLSPNMASAAFHSQIWSGIELWNFHSLWQ